MKLKNDLPLIITYTVGSLGQITLLIAPKDEADYNTHDLYVGLNE